MGGSRSYYYTETMAGSQNAFEIRFGSGYVGKTRCMLMLAIPVGHVKLDTLDKLQSWVEGYTPGRQRQLRLGS